jgi:TPP-dependent pyruvate/acetoin dehydrogenase alpha subunit
MSIDNALRLNLYRQCLRTRYLDEAHQKYIKQGRCQSMSHPATGQEAISAGITAALKPEDILYPTFRGLGDYLGKGTGLNALVAELMGRQGGVTRGVGGVHLGDRANNVHALAGCLGAALSLAAGSALAVKMRGERRVVMIHVGEGAFNTPDSHAMMNMAAIWDLPLVMIITNNQFVEFSYHDVHFPSKADGVGCRADYYKIPNQRVDGNDVEQVYLETRAVVDAARAGKGPALLEMVTCRIGGHYDADPLTYIDKELVDEWKKKDPIDQYETKLQAIGLADQAALQVIREAVKKEVDAAFKLALADKLPDPACLFDHVTEMDGAL